MYIDYILVFTRILHDHLLHAKRVIGKVGDVDLKLQPSKCKFFQKELEYLGHTVSCKRLKTSP